MQCTAEYLCNSLLAVNALLLPPINTRHCFQSMYYTALIDDDYHFAALRNPWFYFNTRR